ncbi:MAG: hypothetical protein ACAI34_11510 [Verrucomicrobium sp.]
MNPHEYILTLRKFSRKQQWLTFALTVTLALWLCGWMMAATHFTSPPHSPWVAFAVNAIIISLIFPIGAGFSSVGRRWQRELGLQCGHCQKAVLGKGLMQTLLTGACPLCQSAQLTSPLPMPCLTDPGSGRLLLPEEGLAQWRDQVSPWQTRALISMGAVWLPALVITVYAKRLPDTDWAQKLVLASVSLLLMGISGTLMLRSHSRRKRRCGLTCPHCARPLEILREGYYCEYCVKKGPLHHLQQLG